MQQLQILFQIVLCKFVWTLMFSVIYFFLFFGKSDLFSLRGASCTYPTAEVPPPGVTVAQMVTEGCPMIEKLAFQISLYASPSLCPCARYLTPNCGSTLHSTRQEPFFVSECRMRGLCKELWGTLTVKKCTVQVLYIYHFTTSGMNFSDPNAKNWQILGRRSSLSPSLSQVSNSKTRCRVTLDCWVIYMSETYKSEMFWFVFNILDGAHNFHQEIETDFMFKIQCTTKQETVPFFSPSLLNWR